MRTASGKYRLEGACADFFGTRVMRIIERGSSIIGRFGREGVIHGSVSGHVLDAEWRDRSRRGWMKLQFDASYKRCDCEYGTSNAGEAALGHAVLTKIERPPRHPQDEV